MALVTLKRVGGIRCHLKQVLCIQLELFPSFFLLTNGWHETYFKRHLMPPTRFNVTEAYHLIIPNFETTLPVAPK